MITDEYLYSLFGDDFLDLGYTVENREPLAPEQKLEVVAGDTIDNDDTV